MQAGDGYAQPAQAPLNNAMQYQQPDPQSFPGLQSPPLQSQSQPDPVHPAFANQLAAPQYAQPKTTRNFSQQTRSKRPRRIGILLLILALVLVVAAVLITVLSSNSGLPGLGGPASQPPITTMQVNSTVTYAGVDITVVNAQQAQSFLDDPNTSNDGVVRLNLQAQNKTSVPVNWSYYTVAQLLLPGKSSVQPTYVKGSTSIAAGATQNSVVDFAVPTSDKISQLTLRLGTANQAQMDIPLTGSANLSKYAPKTTKLNGQMLYFGLNWTLTSATTSLSVSGQQASKGMRYMTLALQVDNTLSQEAITGSPYDYMRLQSGKTTVSPVDSTLPASFATGQSGKTGTVTFLVPQNSTAFTLILLPQTKDSGDQASTDFQIGQ